MIIFLAGLPFSFVIPKGNFSIQMASLSIDSSHVEPQKLFCGDIFV